MVDPRETARQGNEYTTESREKRTVTIAGVTIELSLDSDRYEQEFIEFVAQQTRIGDYEKFKDAKRRATSDTSASSEPLGGTGCSTDPSWVRASGATTRATLCKLRARRS